MRTLVCLLEEESAEEMLQCLLPRIIPSDVHIRFIQFDGKQDLDKQLVRRLRGWRTPDTFFLILRDQDSSDCKKLKAALQDKVSSADRKAVTCIRIACHELESFYLGDLAAVEAGLKVTGLAKKQAKRNYREPDRLPNAQQILREITKTGKGYEKIAGSRAISPHLLLDGSNRSQSFNALIDGIKKLAI